MKIQWVGLGLVGILACSSSESSTSTPAPTPDGGTTPPGTPFTIWAYSARLTAADPHTPIAGATVAIDPPGGGERVELATEADGHVTTNIDFAKGTATISVVAANHVILSFTEFDPSALASVPSPKNPVGKPDTDLVALLGPNGKGAIAQSVELTGKITGKTDVGNMVGLNATGSWAGFQSPGDQYAIRVPKDRAFTLLGFESAPDQGTLERGFQVAGLRVFRIDRPAISANTPLDIDITQGTVTTTPLNWKIELPGGDTGPLGGTSVAFANVTSMDSGVAVGLSEKRELLADRSGWNCVTQVAATDIKPEALRSIAVVQNTDQSVSFVQVAGAAPEGTVFKDFLVPASVVVTKQTRADAISLEGAPAEAEQINVELRSGPDTEWVIVPPFKKKTATVTLPAPPSGATLPSVLSARIISIRDFSQIPNRSDFIAGRVSISKPISITK